MFARGVSGNHSLRKNWSKAAKSFVFSSSLRNSPSSYVSLLFLHARIRMTRSGFLPTCSGYVINTPPATTCDLTTPARRPLI